MDLKTRINLDLKYNLTPDTPKLRYNGEAVSVFLWDNLQNYDELETAVDPLKVHEHYRGSFFTAITEGKFVPWYNIDADTTTYPAYCFEEYEDIEYTDIEEYSVDDPMPVKGKIAQVSLELLQALDLYYNNLQIFDRIQINVQTSAYSGKVVPCYAWFNTVDSIGSYFQEEGLYKLDKGIDLTPFRSITNPAGVSYYEM